MEPRPEEEVLALARRLEQLGEPYRENALRWLERSLDRRLERLPEDLLEVLRDLNPPLRRRLLWNLRAVLDDAVRYFGQSPN